MKTETITINISQDILAALKMGVNDLTQQLRIITAIVFYQEKRLSLGKAAELAELNRLSFMDLLAQKGIIVFDYDESFLMTELDGISEL